MSWTGCVTCANVRSVQAQPTKNASATARPNARDFIAALLHQDISESRFVDRRKVIASLRIAQDRATDSRPGPALNCPLSVALPATAEATLGSVAHLGPQPRVVWHGRSRQIVVRTRPGRPP